MRQPAPSFIKAQEGLQLALKGRLLPLFSTALSPSPSPLLSYMRTHPTKGSFMPSFLTPAHAN